MISVSSATGPQWPEQITPVSIKGKRYYPCPDGIQRVSVTTVERYIGIGTEALIAWAARTEKAAALEAVKQIYDEHAGPEFDGEQFVKMVEQYIGTAKAHIMAMEKAGDVGGQVHDMIEWYLRGELGLPQGDMPKLNPDARQCFTVWIGWWQKAGLKPLRVEQVLWHESLGYAGQLDLLAQGPDGVEILDWKTSNYILPIHHVQVAAYKAMAEQFTPISRCRIVHPPKNLKDIGAGVEVVELGDTYDFSAKRRRQVSEAKLFQSFVGALAVYEAFGGPLEIGETP